jgi:lysyl-tRNA synthetase class 2
MSSPQIPDEAAVRLAKLEAIRAAGIDPYPSDPARTRTAEECHAQYDALVAANESVTVAGRLMALRGHGGSCFADLVDGSGRVQLHFRKDAMPAEVFDRVAAFADRGDLIEATGTLFTTKMGEQTVAVTDWRELAKGLLPLPDKWHGLADVELRYRHRHVDLLANPDVRAIFAKRSAIVREIRNFLDGEGFMEVETPILQTVAGGASARPFSTHHNALDLDLSLRVAPELYLKRLIVGGFEKVYEVARCFRNEGLSFQHNPEFTQVEFYWAYATYEKLMVLTETLVARLARVATGGSTVVTRDEVPLDFAGPFPRRPFADLIRERTGIDLDVADDEAKLRAAITAKGISVGDDAVGYGELCDLLYKKEVRPLIIQPTFVIDYPAEMIPLAKRKPGNPRRIATMQLVVQGMELVKAYNELNDPLEQEQRFMEEERKKGSGSNEAQPADADFVDALKYGMPPTAGFGMGIDRLCTVLLGVHGIKEVILFPTLRPEAAEKGE